MEVARRRIEQIEDHAVGPDQTPGLGDHVVEDLLRLAQDRDPRGDLAERLFRLGAPAEGLARTVELIDQARGPDRDGRLVGDRLEQPAVLLAPGIGTAAEDGQGADRHALDGEWRGHHGLQPGTADVLVRAAAVGEARVVDVVA